MVYLTRRETFNAAHRLAVEGWTDEQNTAAFGKCANPYWHGHNYTLFVTVKGKPNPVTGFVMDAKKLSKLINEKICDQLDHRNINMEVKFLPKGMQPTTENLVYLIWQELAPYLEECQLHSVRLHETENIYAEYFGE
jgi:6-pyruvoyltetrahydropterin/6-carboxytetrahydropterin synthase